MTSVANRYRLLGKLGAGSASVVWRAYDEVLEREVAVKIVSPGTGGTAAVARLRASAGLRDRHVVEVLDVGETGAGLPYVVTDLAEGDSLAGRLSEAALPYRTAVTAGAQIASALASAHVRGIAHGDVRAGNVLVTADGVKLADFGRAAGSPAADMHDFGLLLQKMLTAPAGVELPAGVAGLIQRCLSVRPEDRPTAAEASGTLAAAAGLFPALPRQLTGAGRRPPRRRFVRRRPRRTPVIVGLAAAVGVLVGGGWCVALMDSARTVTSAAPAPPPAAAACTVAYAIRDAVDGRFFAAVLIARTGPARAWRLSFDLPDGQRLVQGWGEGWSQQGSAVRLNGRGASVNSGFEASFQDVAALPGAFRVDGTVCQAQTSVAPTPTTEPEPDLDEPDAGDAFAPPAWRPGPREKKPGPDQRPPGKKAKIRAERAPGQPAISGTSSRAASSSNATPNVSSTTTPPSVTAKTA